METKTVKTPWAASAEGMPLALAYFEGTMVDAVGLSAAQNGNAVALDFLGRKVTYGALMDGIDETARAFAAAGIRAGDRVTVALPNCPQAVFALYALNRLGAVAVMIHPLSAEREIAFYLNDSQSVAAVALDMLYDKFASVLSETHVRTLILTSVADGAVFPVSTALRVMTARKTPRIPQSETVLRWREFLRRGRGTALPDVKKDPHDAAVILYSGGTTGTAKGIVLTDYNLNALGEQIKAANPMYRKGDRMLAAMPFFHGFGLGVCIHSMLAHEGRCVLIPRFTAASYAKQIVRYKCAFIAGVPTLFEALLRLPDMEGADLSRLKGVFSGGDSLSPALKDRFDQFLHEHGARIQVREGYGLTETVTACCLTPPSTNRRGSIGIPFADTYFKIVDRETEEELPYGQEGEILIAGPTVMKEYLNHPEETAQTLRRHADGLVWVRTGDLGVMDSDGFVYFRGRAKRLIVSSGYNVYPASIEAVLDAHEDVQMSCVIGVPDPYRMQKPKAFVKLVPGVPATEETESRLLDYCRAHVAKYAMPYEIEFRAELPRTPIGKVAYRLLEEEEKAKQTAAS